MAITIRQEPTTPNLANSDLLYVVTSNRSSQPQYQFVVDIKDASNTLIQRIKQQPNPSSKGVFNIGAIVPTQLGPTDNVWDTSVVSPNTASGADFKVFFGEEYGSSVSSSVTLYSGNSDVVGEPAKSGSSYYFNLDGHLNELAALNWNWSSGSKYDEEDASDDTDFEHQNGLTAFNTQSVYLGDYGTISFLNGNLAGDPDATNAQNVFAAVYKFYNSAGSQIGSDQFIYNETIYNDPATEQWGDVYTSQSEATRLVHFPTGPQNIVDAGINNVTSSAYYTINFCQQGTDYAPYELGSFGKYRFEIGECSGFDPIRFAWKNQYGVWDYFNFTKANNRTATISRQEYTQTFIDYSTTSNSVTYDRGRRGRNNYYNDVTKQRQANSDWLSQTDADNVRELFFSTNVFTQRPNGEWWPVVITNASITEKTNNLSQKVFQYSANFEYAVGQRPRL